MTRKQVKILKYLHKKPRTVIEVINKFKIEHDNGDFNAFYNLVIPLNDYITIPKQVEPYEKSLLLLTDSGVAFVESCNSKSFDTMLNRLLAVAALIISIIALLKP